MEGGPPRFGPRFTGADLLRNVHLKSMVFRLRDGCPLWCAVPRASTTPWFCNFRRPMHRPDRTPYNPTYATRARLHVRGLGWIPFRSPLLRESRLSLFSSGYSDVSFPRVPSSRPMCSDGGDGPLRPPGFPIRRSVHQSSLAAPHGLSQLATSFIGFRCQGIRHTPLVS